MRVGAWVQAADGLLGACQCGHADAFMPSCFMAVRKHGPMDAWHVRMGGREWVGTNGWEGMGGQKWVGKNGRMGARSWHSCAIPCRVMV